MKKTIFAIVAVLCMAAMTLAACGGGSGSGGNSGGGGKAETYDVGAFSVAVPSGWTAFPQTDILGEKDAEGNYPIDPETIFLAKGASSEMDAYQKANIRIYWYSPDAWVLDGKELYEDVEDITGVTINGVDSTAYAGTTYGYRYQFIHMNTDDAQYDFTILISVDGKDTGVTWEDADIKTIMESVTTK